ncbi:hypothetical protein AG0111_0g8542 [Alternaria gaisen]|uniref:Uncharacterized protein n=1 Tax=Alternaria gaisen TaxID=167740 RepID=A0ACB6FGL2_9PLEO|nr:hypothetical protein AG0111_0g8542 [Alternaria gaisen]
MRVVRAPDSLEHIHELIALINDATLPSIVQSHQRSIGANGAVTSEVEVCSKVGIDLLRDGGNAADAAIGTTLCVGVVAMYHSG